MRKTSLSILGLSSVCLALSCASPTPHKATPDHASFSASGPDTVAGEILVDLKDNVSDSDVKELSEIAGTDLHENNDVAKQYRYEVGNVDPAKEDSVIARLQSDPRVDHAEKMNVYKALYVPNDPLYATDQWHMTRIGTESSWGMSCGAGVKVAVVDTGVSCMEADGVTRLSDLAKCESGYNFVDNTPIAYDGNLHGSHVAGTIAQTTNNGIGGAGIAYCATILPVKVLSDSGSGSSEGVAEGIRYAADQGAQVINMSLGSDYPSDVIKDAVNYAHDKGVVIVCAAGNSGGPVGYPAAYTNAIAVSATDENDNIARFSSRGKEVAVGAPGVNVMQQTICEDDPKSDGCFMKLNGTSMASPAVAGAAVLLVSSGITDPDSVKAKLQATADPKDDAKLFGAGILRADSAVRSTLLSHAFGRFLALLALMFLVKGAVKSQWKDKLSMLGIALGGFGLLMPLAFTGLMPHMGSMRFLGELAIRPIGEWDIVMGLNHKWLLLANFVPATIASLLMMGHNRMRMFAGGLSLGTAALCTQMFVSNDVHFFLGSLAMRVFLGASVAISVYLAKAAFTAKTA